MALCDILCRNTLTYLLTYLLICSRLSRPTPYCADTLTRARVWKWRVSVNILLDVVYDHRFSRQMHIFVFMRSLIWIFKKNSIREDSCGHQFTRCVCMKGIHSFIHSCLFAQTSMYNMWTESWEMPHRKSCKTLVTASKLKIHQNRSILRCTKYMSGTQRLIALYKRWEINTLNCST